MKRTVIFSILVVLLLAACGSLRQEVEPKGIVQEPEKLVVACFISPQDTVLAARVTRSSPVLGVNSGINDVSNATVTLSDGVRSVVLKAKSTVLYGSASTTYRANAGELPIVVGKTYTLAVTVPDGRTVTSTCTIPNAVAIEQMTLDSSITTEFGEKRQTYRAQLRWRDPAGQANFYRVAGSSEYANRYRISGTATSPARDTIVRYRGDWYFENGSTTTDIGRDGQEIVSTRGRLATYSYTRINGILLAQPPSGQVDGYLLNIDENYYRYHDAVERQNQAGDNPFSEPVLIPSNIQGGLGCFGAYNRSTLTSVVK